MMRLRDVRMLTAAGLSEPRTLEIDVIGDSAELDAGGLILSPGWVDLHAHLRDPGFLESETLQSGASSAAAGGFTQVTAMANTNPVTDRPSLVADLVRRSESLPVRVGVVGALTEHLAGRKLTDAAGLKAAGAIALSDDGRHAIDRDLLRRGLEAAGKAGLPVLVHGQKESRGKDPAAEYEGIEEALLALRDAPGARLHLQHISTRRSLDLVRAAKADGLAVTAEVTPHHLALTNADVEGNQANVSPPLRTTDDRDAVVEGLIDGVIDVIATDHAPHTVAAKAAGANGFHGFETAAGVIFGLRLPWQVMHRSLVERPRQILGLAAADDWVLIDPGEAWLVEPQNFQSRGRNTPFAGRRLRGRVVLTICRQRIVHRAEVAVG
jgi:dihydroorotase